MNIRLEFWRSQGNWPRDTAKFVFLARAVHEIGRALFKEEWTGDEPAVELFQSLPAIRPHGSSGRAYFAHELLMRHRPDFNRKPIVRSGPSQGFSSPPPILSFTSEEWIAALTLVRENHEKNRPALVRFDQVQRRVVDWAEAGQLVTALRPRVGGDPTVISRELWNTERTQNRFDNCLMNPSKPFDIGSAGDAYYWIYATRESLDAAIASGQEKAPTIQGKPQPARMSALDKRQIFKEWRDSCGARTPTLPEDIAAMKERGINRDDARQLRKDHPRLPRGRQPARP